jgi:hypothetical protein
MNWKEQLSVLETNKQWDNAIEFIKEYIAHNPNDVEAYIFINYLLMNLLVEENYDDSKHDLYKKLIKHYFNESYRKFSHNPEYLFFTGITAVMSEWYFGITVDDYEKMLKQATELAPHNDLYRISYYFGHKNSNTQLALHYAREVLDPQGSVQKQLQDKGAIGAYYLELITNTAKSILATSH